MVFKIAACAGHGYNTSGKRSPNDEREWSFNNKVILAFEEALKQYENVEFLRTDDRTGKTDIPLKTRTDKANAWKADIYISFHHNALEGVWGSHTGTETYTYTGSNPKSEKLASLVHSKIIKAYGLKDRGMKKANFHIVRETHMPAILIEGGYMDSTIDILKLRDDKILKAVGYAVAQGVAEYAGLHKKVIVKPKLIPSGLAYVVEKGDTLWSVAHEHNISVDELKKLNNLKGDIINIGDILVIKDGIIKPTPQKPIPQAKSKYILPDCVLKKGDHNANVGLLQKALNAAGFKCGNVDNDFGNKTLDALKRFQSVYCNPVDGVYGPKTKKALDKKIN